MLIDIQNGFCDVTTGGWERRVIGREDRDGQRWLELLDRAATPRGWRVFPRALVRNHQQLYLRTARPNVSAAECTTLQAASGRGRPHG